jgi:hypothetical protein
MTKDDRFHSLVQWSGWLLLKFVDHSVETSSERGLFYVEACTAECRGSLGWINQQFRDSRYWVVRCITVMIHEPVCFSSDLLRWYVFERCLSRPHR